jgi:hypothetical protein
MATAFGKGLAMTHKLSLYPLNGYLERTCILLKILSTCARGVDGRTPIIGERSLSSYTPLSTYRTITLCVGESLYRSADM